MFGGGEKRQLYNKIIIYKNSNVEYISEDEIVNSYQHTILFFYNKTPVRIVFLRNCNLEKATIEAFSIKCLPNEKSVEDLVGLNKMTIEIKDLQQKTNNIFIDKQLGSCNRLNLLTQMLDGAITADGTGEKLSVEKLEFDSNFMLTIYVDLKDFIVNIRHKGVFKLNKKRWIILQNI